MKSASGIARWGDVLFVVQDNANWLAIVDGDDEVTGLPLPRGAGGARLFEKSRDNAGDKTDLEACVVLPTEDGAELVAFGSGTDQNRRWVLHVDGADRAAESRRGGEGCTATFLDAARFYESLEANIDFCGGALNIEGAIALDDDRILLFQRGNAPPDKGKPVDATGQISWRKLKAHLDCPDSVPPPPIEEVIQYDLGELNGVRLTFSDAEHLDNGGILFSASAEDPSEDGKITGSVLGVIDTAGEARWAHILDEGGAPFTSKIEGLSFPPGTKSRVRFVIDDDDETAPSEMFEAELSSGFGLDS